MACSIRDKGNVYRFFVGCLKEIGRCEDLATYGKIILKWILKNRNKISWTGFLRFRIRKNVGGEGGYKSVVTYLMVRQNAEIFFWLDGRLLATK